jgi:hypothetical protein
MAERETSPAISSIAGKHAKITGQAIMLLVEDGRADQLAGEIRQMAASLLSQDETRGQGDRR